MSRCAGRFSMERGGICRSAPELREEDMMQGVSFNLFRFPVKRAHGNLLVPKLVDILASIILFVNDKIPPYSRVEK